MTKKGLAEKIRKSLLRFFRLKNERKEVQVIEDKESQVYISISPYSMKEEIGYTKRDEEGRLIFVPGKHLLSDWIRWMRRRR